MFEDAAYWCELVSSVSPFCGFRVFAVLAVLGGSQRFCSFRACFRGFRDFRVSRFSRFSQLSRFSQFACFGRSRHSCCFRISALMTSPYNICTGKARKLIGNLNREVPVSLSLQQLFADVQANTRIYIVLPYSLLPLHLQSLIFMVCRYMYSHHITLCSIPLDDAASLFSSLNYSAFRGVPHLVTSNETALHVMRTSTPPSTHTQTHRYVDRKGYTQGTQIQRDRCKITIRIQ